MTNDTALLIIDVQKGLIDDAYQHDEVLEHIKLLLAKARANNKLVIYVQHDGPKGHGLEVGIDGWQISPVIAPQEGEPVVHKRGSDAFHETPLKQVLDQRRIRHLVVAGGQTEYCVDTTVRRATTCGYDVTLVSDAHTTYDCETLTADQIIAFYNETLNGFHTGTCNIIVKPTREIVL
ncbi:MAG: cysteine hydrolase [Ktedonobacteraceae bacterium]|nr:cysteine hydrolase [Ktedonobacteraceae bacterium]